MKNLLMVSSLFVLFLLANSALSQVVDLDSSQVDTSSSFTLAPQDRKPSGRGLAWSVRRAESKAILAQDIVDYVDLLPGVSALDMGSIGQFSPLGLRGATPQESKLFFDGILLDEPIMGAIFSKFIPLNLVESLAFVGPSPFAPFGATAIAGIFRVEPFQFQGKQPYSKVVFRAGDFGYSDIGIIFGLPVTQRTAFVLSGNRQEFDGLNRNHDGSRILTRVSHTVNKNLLVEHRVFFNRNDLTVPAPFTPIWVPGSFTTHWEESRLDQVLSIRFGNRALHDRQFQTQLIFSRIRQNASVDTLTFNNKNITLGLGFQYEMDWKRHGLSFGGEIKLHDLNGATLGNRSDQIGSLYVRDHFQMVDKLGLGLQFKIEKQNGFSAAFNPSAQIAYQFAHGSKLWFGVQRANRYPTFSERYWPTRSYQGNAQLSDEIGTALEVGLDLKTNDKFQLQTSLFVNDVDDWIGNVILPDTLAIRVANLGKRTISGVDLKFTWNRFPGGRFGFTGSYRNLRQEADEKQLQVPEYTIYSYLESGRSFFEDYVFITLRLVARLFGQRHGIDFFTGNGLPKFIALDATGILDGQITLQFTDAKFVASIENLFDTAYQLVPGFFMPPRTLKIGIEWEFLD